MEPNVISDSLILDRAESSVLVSSTSIRLYIIFTMSYFPIPIVPTIVAIQAKLSDPSMVLIQYTSFLLISEIS